LKKRERKVIPKQKVPVRKGRILKKCGMTLSLIVLVLIGFIFTFQQPLTVWMLGHHEKQYALNSLSKKTLQDNLKKGSFNTSGVKTVNFFDVAKAQMEKQTYPAIGAMAYPDLGINLPLFNGDSNTTMLYGAGTMKAGEKMGEGNFALASHHVSNVMGHAADGLLFSPLQKATVGQSVYLTDKEKVYHYLTTEVIKISPEEGTVILDHEGKKEITLVTCDSDDRYRLIVKGVLKEVLPFDQNTAHWFSGNYTQYWK
jgi:sortase A